MYFKKGQSAMEYLMTYGWAILIILIAVGALFSLGVFSPSVPNTCQFNTPFMCMGGDVKGTEAGTSDTLEFNIGVQSGISTPTLTAVTLGGEDILADCGTPTPTLTAGVETSVTCTGEYFTSVGEKFSGNVDFSYVGEAGTHTSSGTFSGTVEV